jgi:glycine/D-amino acid oxidase-like deaminating enzyme
MIVDTSGVYFHPEAMNGLAGFANTDEPAGVNFEYDGERFFEERIWPALYERSTAFERLKHVTGWAGLYEVSPDECGIIGSVQEGVFEAHSFSGHGVMHSYAAGLALAETIVNPRSKTVDITQLSGRRFIDGKLIQENLVI